MGAALPPRQYHPAGHGVPTHSFEPGAQYAPEGVRKSHDKHAAGSAAPGWGLYVPSGQFWGQAGRSGERVKGGPA